MKNGTMRGKDKNRPNAESRGRRRKGDEEQTEGYSKQKGVE